MKLVRLKRRETIFACVKCLKRHPDAKAIRRALKSGAKACDAKLVRVSCLGLCPKRAVVVASRASVAAGQVVLVTDASEVTDALAALEANSAR